MAAVSYYDRTNRALKLARRSGAVWTVETVDDAGDVGAASSVAFDLAGEPAIAYTDASDAVKLALWNGTAWVPEVVDGNARATFVGLAFDAGGEPAVGYVDLITGGLRVARRDGPGWLAEEAGNDRAGASGGFAIDSGGSDTFVWYHVCQEALMLSRSGGTPAPYRLHRGTVAALVAGWRQTALPLSAANDDETAPFPWPTAAPGSYDDAVAPAAALVMYRLLDDLSQPTGAAVRCVRAGGSVRVSW